MGVFGAFFGCIGDGGFSGCCSRARSGDGGFMLAYISACRGVIGFNVAKWPCSVHEKVRPARPDLCVSAKKFALQAQNGRKTLFSGALGELFRGSVGGGAVLGKFCRGNAGGWVTLGELFRACCGKGRHSDGFLSKRAVF